MPSSEAASATSASTTSGTATASGSDPVTGSGVVDPSEDQGASDEVVTYGDEGENEGEMDQLGSVGLGLGGGLLANSDIMADIKNSLLRETIANSVSSSSDNSDGQPTNGLDLKSLRLGGFDAATLSGLNSLAAAATAVNGTSPVAASSALSMGGLAHHFSPYGTLPPPLLPYPHLAASKLYSPFSGIPGLQIPPPPPTAAGALDPKGAALTNGAPHPTSISGASAAQQPSSSSSSSSSPHQMTSSATYNTAAVSAALSNWAAVVSPQNPRLPLAPPPGLSPNSLANLNPLQGAGGPVSASSSSSPLAMFAAHMFTGGRHAAGPGGAGGSSAAAAAASNPYHQLLAAVSAGDLSRTNPAFARGAGGAGFGTPEHTAGAGLPPHGGPPGSLLGHPSQGPEGLRSSGSAPGGGGEMGDQNHHPQHSIKEKPPKPAKPYVKKPLNAFMLFMKENREKVMQESTLKESAAINQILGRKWHQLEKTEQNRYYEMAKNERLAHQRLHPAWSARDNYATSKHRKRRKRSLSGFPNDGMPPDDGFPMGMPDPSGRLPNGFLRMENLAGLTDDQQADVFIQGGGHLPPHGHGMIPGLMPHHPSHNGSRGLPGGLPGGSGGSGVLGGHEGQQSGEVSVPGGSGGVLGGGSGGAKSTSVHSVKSLVSSSSDSNNPSGGGTSDNIEHTPESASKKCRARFGLEQQESWCKHCRRKKKCSVFTGNDEPSSTTSGSGGNSGSNTTPPNSKEKKNASGLVTPKSIKFPVDARNTRTSSEDESPGFNTDSMAAIKNELVSSLLSESRNMAQVVNDYPAPSKKPRSENHPGNVSHSIASQAVSSLVSETRDKNAIVKHEPTNSDVPNDIEVNSNGIEAASEAGSDHGRGTSYQSHVDVSGAATSGSGKESLSNAGSSGSNTGTNCSLASAANKLPLSLQGQIISHLNNNHINNSSFTSHNIEDKTNSPASLAAAAVRAPVTAAFLTNGVKQNSSISPFELAAALPIQSPTGSTKDINALSPLLDLHPASTLNNINNNISSLGAIKRSPKSQNNSSESSNVAPTPPSSLAMTSELASIASSNPAANSISSSLKTTAGHIPFPFSPFNTSALTSVSNSTTPNSPFSPLQPTLAAAAAGSLFSAGSLFAAASGAANGTVTAPSIPFNPFFNPAGFPGASFPAFKDPKDAMASIALTSSSPATASQS
ncbi:uncharacterized protein LOC142337556 isoform X2 [Convolutriloba macropyga]|uniref:uncharacterized protein LOC142337556 isoform X2 n=1 Tax=Convolutriloba macropyga TaxID=536237 RepID=UPI003F51DCEC